MAKTTITARQIRRMDGGASTGFWMGGPAGLGIVTQDTVFFRRLAQGTVNELGVSPNNISEGVRIVIIIWNPTQVTIPFKLSTVAGSGNTDFGTRTVNIAAGSSYKTELIKAAGAIYTLSSSNTFIPLNL